MSQILREPTGSTVPNVLTTDNCAEVRPELADRVVLINPASNDEMVLGFNLIPMDIENVSYITTMMMSAVLKTLGQDNAMMTPRISNWLRLIFYPLIEKRLSLLEARPFLSIHDKDRRHDLLSGIINETIAEGWIDFDHMQPRERRQMIEGVQNRLVNFLESRQIRYMIGQRDSTFDLRQVVEEGKILLVNLNGGVEIPSHNTHLFGVMLITELFRIAKLRDYKDPHLKPFHLFIDEFGQYVTRDIAEMIEQCRKFKIFLTLAHQHLAQLRKDDEYLYASVLTNCRNKIVFGELSVEDTDIMTQEILTGFYDLKTIKDKMYAARFRPVETERTVHVNLQSKGQTVSKGGADKHSKGTGTTNAQYQGTQTTDQHEINEGLKRAETMQVIQREDLEHREVKTSGNNQEKMNTEKRGKSVSDSSGNQTSRTTNENFSQESNWTESETESAQTGENIVPFNASEEFKEQVSRTFWSLEEVKHMAMARVKNQKTGYAFVKLNDQKPVEVKIDFVKSVKFNPDYSPERLQQFKQRVFNAHDGYYKSVRDARLEYEMRQRQLFSDGQPIIFDEEPIEIDEQPIEQKPAKRKLFNV